MEITTPRTETTRAQYRRDGLGFSSNLTDEEACPTVRLMPAKDVKAYVKRNKNDKLETLNERIKRLEELQDPRNAQRQ